MSLSHRYQEFGAKPVEPAGLSSLQDEEAVEDQKLQSFEDGYKAGWDDASNAQAQIRNHVSAEFARNLQEASFAYHEARAALAKELRGVLEPLIERLLPAIARESLGAHIVEQVGHLIRNELERPIEIVVAPTRKATIEDLLQAALPEPFVISTDDTLGEDQAFLRVGARERQIDFDTWLAEVRNTLAAHFDTAEKESSDG